jgi:hypothetical protein
MPILAVTPGEAGVQEASKREKATRVRRNDGAEARFLAYPRSGASHLEATSPSGEE